MKTIKIRDYFNANETVGVRVTPIALGTAEARSHAGGHTHYAVLNDRQIASLKHRLSNGPKGINVIEIDQYTGKDSAAEVYFDL